MPRVLLSVLSAALIATAAASMTTPSGTPGHDMTSTDRMSGAYQVYTKAAFDAAKGSQRVLFFHATWCPSCKGADADIVKNLAKLPAGVTIFKADYDKETALKKRYGITSQHSFVLVDMQGKALKKWSGGGLKEIMTYTAAKKM